MGRMKGNSGGLTSLVLSDALVATAQVPTGVTTDAPGSDRAGKRLGADRPPAEPAPAAGQPQSHPGWP